MRKSDFYFDLPRELIAQTPLERRDASRLLCMDRVTGALQHRQFVDLPELLNPGDCLALNDSRVLPARLIGTRSGGAAELLLLRDLGSGRWECMCKPGKKIGPGARLSFGDGELLGTVTELVSGGNRIVDFEYEGIFLEVLERLGRTPLPPYIHAELEDGERYQTVYAKQIGSAAAPTAGLHFTPELLAQLQSQGVGVGYVTLHVGLGTFRPVKAQRVEDHAMHSEAYAVPEETAALINETKARGGRVIAVGTTCCRTLESVVRQHGAMRACAGQTDIFLYPGCEFRCIDGLLTNFHLPESTLIMLVSAFYGREKTLRAYETAVAQGYRFYSFGDCMLVL